MGLDIGSRTIGVAVSDELGIAAQAIKTIKRKSLEEDFREIKAIISDYEVKKVVVGLPRNMDGTLGKGAESVFQWIQTFKKSFDLPVVTWDERLTTVQATKILLEADLSREKRRKVVDKVAAVLILQGYLDRSRNQTDDLLLPA